jgi:hypothetical protein
MFAEEIIEIVTKMFFFWKLLFVGLCKKILVKKNENLQRCAWVRLLKKLLKTSQKCFF